MALLVDFLSKQLLQQISFLLGGVQYIRWGRSSCPNNTELLYSGVAAGSNQVQQGGGSDHLCLHPEPEYLLFLTGNQDDRSGITGTEYQSPPELLGNVNNRNMPCAACYATDRVAKIMIPGRITCMPTWTKEYHGYLMTDRHDFFRSSFACVDMNPEALPNSAADNNGHLFYHVEVRECGGVRCLPLPYIEGHELACVVCTK